MYRYSICFLLAFIACMATSKAQDKEISKELYKAETIPDSLKEDANSVVRYSLTDITIKGPGKAVIKKHKLITILNEKADNQAVLVLGYNKKYDSYSDIEMHVYDAKGNSLKKYHKTDMYDGSAADDETMVTNERFMAVKHTIASYPVTVEIQYEEDDNSFISPDSWMIQDRAEQAVQLAACKVKVNPAVGFRYKDANSTIKPVKSVNGGMDSYYWEVNNLKAIKKEEHVLPWKIYPEVRFAVNNFDCYGYPGNFSSWKSFGQWIEVLNSKVCTLSPERTAEIRKMTDTIKTDKEKARFLYNYMQKSMRYVSIQLGIGGYQPFPASFVDQKKYGDCKALSNYMKALLQAVNIKSYYAIIKSGSNQSGADANFPVNSFDHAILCLPFKNDTTWLECTSNTQPFGELGSFTENRNALLITEDGGVLVNTPKSTMIENQFNSEAHVVLDADGGAKAQVKIFCTGGYRSDYIDLTALKLDEQKETMMHLLNIRQPSEFDYKPADDKEGVKEIDINLDYDRFCDVMAGDKQFYRPRVLDLCAFTVPVEEKRKTDYYFDMPLQKSCTTTIDLPAGFEIETLPVNQSLKFSYGSYNISYTYDASKNQVVSVAKFNINDFKIPAAKYTELQQYLDAVAKAQNKKMVIKRKA